MKRLSVLTAALALTGCASLTPDYTGLEYEHQSHPWVGPPFSPQSDEDYLDVLQGVAGYKIGSRGYLEIMTGRSLTNGGFYGPDWTGGIRAGALITGQR